ncbi:hypothetical protein [Desulfobacter latus]|uniref:Uncharacterized protein n=1 Tax=Desulfobacter latus TaxID=2292 RepID=A0A850TBW3_9BACT|nr:hypothetical protein [Desulfobacter latus]NWH06178.1 hypothetical protein [Desulfobacter latus]
MKNGAWIVIFGMVLVNGCVSSLDLMTDDTNPYTGQPSSYYESKMKKDLSKGEFIAQATVQEIKMVFSREYENDDIVFDATYKRMGHILSIDLVWMTPTGFFPSGEYNALLTKSHSGRTSVKYAALVAEVVQKVVEKLDDSGMSQHYRIISMASGTADGDRIIRPIRYRGEYGSIDVPAEKSTLNGKPHGFQLKPYEQIDNAKLAFLRAYSLQTLVLGLLPSHLRVSDSYSVRTLKERGLEFRKACVRIEIEENP